MVEMSERVMNPISTAELERRWSAVRREMANRKIDVLYTYQSNEWSAGYTKYLSDRMPGNGMFFSVIFPKDEEMTLIAAGGLHGENKLPPGGDGVLRGVKRVLTEPHFLGATFSEGLLRDTTEKALSAYANGTIGLVGPGMMSYTLMTQLKTKFTKANFVDATDLLDEIMVIKSDEEIAGIRRSAELQDKAFQAVLDQVKPGMRDFEVTAIAEQVTRLGGSETGLLSGSSAPIGAGIQMAFRHLQNRVLQKGDQFTILIETAGPGGFFCELGRSFCLGKATQKMKDEQAICIEAQKVTTDMMKPGASCPEIWDANNSFLREHNRPEENRLYAHGQGYFLVERPLLRFDEPMILKSRMNIAVHPMYKKDGLFSWMCDNFLMSDNGVERLHKTPQHIFEVE